MDRRPDQKYFSIPKDTKGRKTQKALATWQAMASGALRSAECDRSRRSHAYPKAARFSMDLMMVRLALSLLARSSF
jgi:hypothetical protein